MKSAVLVLRAMVSLRAWSRQGTFSYENIIEEREAPVKGGARKEVLVIRMAGHAQPLDMHGRNGHPWRELCGWGVSRPVRESPCSSVAVPPYPRISTSASTSTGTLKGSSAMPTAEREWVPISGPKTS